MRRGVEASRCGRRGKVLTAKLGADSGVAAEFEHFFFKVGVAKSVSEG